MESTQLNGEKVNKKRKVVIHPFAILLGVAVALGLLIWFACEKLSFSPVANVTQEYGPRSTIEIFDWFEDTAAKIHKKQRDILIYESFLKRLRDSYGDKLPEHWAANERDQLFTWSREVIAIKYEQDVLAREFNTEMTDPLWELVNGIREAKAQVTAIPRLFMTYYPLPPPPV